MRIESRNKLTNHTQRSRISTANYARIILKLVSFHVHTPPKPVAEPLVLLRVIAGLFDSGFLATFFVLFPETSMSIIPSLSSPELISIVTAFLLPVGLSDLLGRGIVPKRVQMWSWFRCSICLLRHMTMII